MIPYRLAIQLVNAFKAFHGLAFGSSLEKQPNSTPSLDTMIKQLFEDAKKVGAVELPLADDFQADGDFVDPKDDLVIAFYKNGYTVGGGNLMDYAGKSFESMMAEMKCGFIPVPLQVYLSPDSDLLGVQLIDRSAVVHP